MLVNRWRVLKILRLREIEIAIRIYYIAAIQEATEALTSNIVNSLR